MDHLQNVIGYFDQQQPLCAEHDRIAKDLYREFGATTFLAVYEALYFYSLL